MELIFCEKMPVIEHLEPYVFQEAPEHEHEPTLCFQKQIFYALTWAYHDEGIGVLVTDQTIRCEYTDEFGVVHEVETKDLPEWAKQFLDLRKFRSFKEHSAAIREVIKDADAFGRLIVLHYPYQPEWDEQDARDFISDAIAKGEVIKEKIDYGF